MVILSISLEKVDTMDTINTKAIYSNAFGCISYKTQRDTNDATIYLINLSKSYIYQWL